jgi:hypothetical protein
LAQKGVYNYNLSCGAKEKGGDERRVRSFYGDRVLLPPSLASSTINIAPVAMQQFWLEGTLSRLKIIGK